MLGSSDLGGGGTRVAFERRMLFDKMNTQASSSALRRRRRPVQHLLTPDMFGRPVAALTRTRLNDIAHGGFRRSFNNVRHRRR
ncbi:MAG: hypothetical protein ACLQUT_12850 [Thermoleophilia bacterium]